MSKSILITGCSTGIGLHCAKRLKEDGWQVFATARKKKDITALNKLGLTAFHLDYTDTKSIHKCLKEVLAQTDGKLDALFNNGAYGQPGAVEDLSTNDLRAQFEANFFGWHELTNLVVPIMRKQKAGRIVHCSSVLGFVTLPWRGAYNASKFALEGLAITMRLETKGSGVHVSLIEPGPILSDFSKNALKKFEQNIDIKNSVHRKTYEAQLARLNDGGGVNRFRLGPEAVYDKLKHALNHKKPKAQYFVTVPTHFMGAAKRILPNFLLERLLIKSQ
ncbi:MAG: SDR family oxidoreductase [Rhizobiales bacterium]|nr:SDR family oxidoreductase [Hyphomicrobiales bacterium]